MPVGLLNVDGFYNSLLSFIDKAVDEGFISSTSRRIIVSAPTAKQLMLDLEWEVLRRVSSPLPFSTFPLSPFFSFPACLSSSFKEAILGLSFLMKGLRGSQPGRLYPILQLIWNRPYYDEKTHS
ncbi:hypothetical protein HN51_040809 [Arachis hypogaea]